ncbi:MAG: tetratricopeptide repeat protein [Rikenellaceae bacterium]|jgi:tetratricopeptide (TPR) repeat protein|nr:tetratricopeptide repeat protein [Rikenellaceae bacterium]
MNKIKFTLAVFAIFAVTAISAQSLTDINTKFSEAAAAMGAKDFAKAATLFEQVIDEGLDVEGAEEMVLGAKKYLPQAIFVQGGAAFQKGSLDDALAKFSQAASLAELYGEVGVLNNARTWIGRTVLKQGADAFNNKDYATAATIFQKGYEGNPNDTAVALNLAMSYSEMGDYAKGNEVYQSIIALEGENSRFDEAVARAKSEFVTYNLVRASKSAQDKAYDEAITATEDILAVLPANPEAMMLRLQTYNSTKNYPKVIELGDATAAAQTDAALKSVANFLVGAAYQNSENYGKATEYYQKVTAGDNVAAAKAQIAELAKITK